MERTVNIKTMTNYFPLIYQRLVVGSLCLIFIVKAEDKGCVRRVAGSEKREWQKVRGGEVDQQQHSSLFNIELHCFDGALLLRGSAGWLVGWMIRKH